LNQCFVEFAPVGALSYEAVSLETKLDILKSLIRVWEPSWGSICSRALRRKVREQHNIELDLSCGEVTFLGIDRPGLPDAVEHDYRVEDFAPYGRLILIEGGDPLAEHRIRRAAELCATLEEAGIFYRYPA
jgi:hypothetical protein